MKGKEEGYLPGSSKLMASSYICVMSMCRYCLYMSRAYAYLSECECVFLWFGRELCKIRKFHDCLSCGKTRTEDTAKGGI